MLMLFVMLSVEGISRPLKCVERSSPVLIKSDESFRLEALRSSICMRIMMLLLVSLCRTRAC